MTTWLHDQVLAFAASFLLTKICMRALWRDLNLMLTGAGKTKGRGLRKLVEATGLSQKEISARFDVSPEAFSRWVTGTVKPQHPGMLRLALQMLVVERYAREDAAARKES